MTFKVTCGSVGDLDAHEEKKGDYKKKLRILIAGGGIAGLVFALAAKRNGFDVKVFEKDLTAVRGEGRDRGPIQLLSSALGLLESIDKDVARAIMEAGYVTGDRNNGLADGTTGEWFAKFDFLTPAIHKGIPVTQIICRMELQRILLNAVGDDTVINNYKVVDFVNNDDKVTVFLDNGQQCEGDLLVGADGIRSMDCYWLMFELQNLSQMHPISEITLDELTKSFRRFEKKRMFRVRTVHTTCRIASVMTSIYQTYLDIGPLPLFNISALRVKHPAVLFGNKVLQLASPKFMDWVVVGQ